VLEHHGGRPHGREKEIEMIRPALAIVTPLLMCSSAFADDPKYIKEYSLNLSNCRPSCYDNEPAVKAKASDYKRVCAYKDWTFQSVKPRGSGWTPLESGGIPAVDPTLTSCKFPKDSGGKWKKHVAQAKRAFKQFGGDLEKLRFVVQGGWKHDRDDNLDPIKWIKVRIYAANWDLKPNECGSHGTETVCEASGSQGARAFNYIRYRIDEAKKYKKSNPEACRTSSFAAVATARGVRKFRAGRIENDTWAPGLTYKTRYDGMLKEKELFAMVDEYEEEALALHEKCGGKAELVTEVEEGPSPEFDVVPDPSKE
jgi:hypothetical protein